MNNYSDRNGRRQYKDHDIAGIVLMIVSVFLLLCTVFTKYIFGIVSQAIGNVILGVFGIFSYALFSFTFALGLVLLLKRRPAVSAKKLLCVIGIVVSLMLILQLSTTNGYLDAGFGNYLGEVYAAKYTAGGVFFGIFAYAVKAMATRVGAYIIFSVLLLLFVALLALIIRKEYGVFSGVTRRVAGAKDKKTAAQANTDKFEDKAPPQRVYNFLSTDLFVENIMAPNENAESYPDDENDNASGGLYDAASEYGAFGRRHPTQTQATNILYPAGNADFDNDPIYRDMGMGKPQEHTEDERDRAVPPGTKYYDESEPASVSRPAETYSAPDVHKATEYDVSRRKPDKIFHDDRNNNGFSDVIIPTPKQQENDYNPGEIVNSAAGERGGYNGFSSLGDDRGYNGVRFEDDRFSQARKEEHGESYCDEVAESAPREHFADKEDAERIAAGAGRP